MQRTLLWSLVLYMLVCASCVGVTFAESVDITVPTSVVFNVIDISTATTGSPNPTTVSFVNANLVSGSALRISVKANAADFISPGGTAIAASNVSWTTGNAQGGTSFNGSLSSVGFTEVYQSNANPTSGTVDIVWSLAAQGSGIRGGDHTLAITWKLESVVP
ncbi:MAG: hypothetical protein Q7N50_03640 [Armatimonadota bacterium]|nr:hypothetical protein [Armatimonadota bacterium]